MYVILINIFIVFFLISINFLVVRILVSWHIFSRYYYYLKGVFLFILFLSGLFCLHEYSCFLIYSLVVVIGVLLHFNWFDIVMLRLTNAWTLQAIIWGIALYRSIWKNYIKRQNPVFFVFSFMFLAYLFPMFVFKIIYLEFINDSFLKFYLSKVASKEVSSLVFSQSNLIINRYIFFKKKEHTKFILNGTTLKSVIILFKELSIMYYPVHKSL